MEAPLAPSRVADLYWFGWRNLGGALREHGWFYLPLAVLAAWLSVTRQPAAQIAASYINVLAFIPALAFASRLARPSVGIHARELLGLLGIWAIVDGSLWIFIELARIWNALLIALLFLFIPYVWIAVKLSLAPAIFLLRSPSASIRDAFRSSWEYVEDDRWLRIFGLQILISLPVGVITFSLRHWQTTLAGALTIYALSVVTAVWSQISLVAMATNTGVPEEHTDAVPV